MESGSSGRTTDSGWAAFAGVIMFIVGSLDALWGLGAILNNNIVVVGGQGAIVANITTWGWVHLILGSMVALTGLGLLDRQHGRSMARGLLRLGQRDPSDRLVPRGAVVGLSDHHPRRDDHLPAHGTLERPRSLGLIASS